MKDVVGKVLLAIIAVLLFVNLLVVFSRSSLRVGSAQSPNSQTRTNARLTFAEIRAAFRAKAEYDISNSEQLQGVKVDDYIVSTVGGQAMADQFRAKGFDYIGLVQFKPQGLGGYMSYGHPAGRDVSVWILQETHLVD